ncbi:unnamed protein product (macronuclear) [Paramecium tetraurelia]|uniref:Calponin-homology (CH) domain-containing protein n=1 Tax=Paramecium tetraurelia TaxID=5888 RepID=A0DZ59_PARTE|nr:uncharacterized protein GSPATT00003295001 [Paramecium tetraurelia]CAK88326.1 unnamed protein product [Paramecium tetraurelia]|eukprot:XP_001455723.1 hypothetical protein (macronuclear) [Paramecium tetraurelia strain d4-2]
MQIQENLYNWLCQLRVLPQDGKKYADKVEINKTTLGQLENGIAFGQLLKEIVKLRNRPSTPLAKLDTLKDNQQKSSILYNWKILCEEYQKVDIMIDQDTKALILGGDKEMIHSLLLEIYDKNYRGQQKSHLLDDSQLSLDGATKILATNKISQANQQVDLSKLDPKKDLNKTQNCLEFFIIALAKNLQLTIKQAASLFTNNNKYLAHILAKGVKGVFEPIIAFYKETYANSNQLNKLFNEDATKKSMIFAFQALKPGLVSKSYDVVYEAVRLFTRLGSLIPVQLIREWFLEDQGGLYTALMGARRHPELVQFQVELILQFGRNNFVEVFTTGIRQVLSDTKDFINAIELIFIPLSENQELVSTGILNDWVTQAIGIAENEFKNTIDTRISSLNFLSEVLLVNTELDESLINTIITLLKKGTRDKSQSLSLLCLSHLFKLLISISKQKSNLAPTIYKNLTIALVENHDNQQIREFILNNFIQIFQTIEAISINLVLENLIKQLQTSEGVTYILNIFDMHFFMFISNLNMGIKNAIQLLDFLAKIFLNNLVYQSIAFEIILNILSKNVENQTMQEFILKFIKIALAIFFASEKKKQGKDQIHAQKRNQIIQIIKTIVQFQQHQMNEKIKPLVAHTNIQVKQFNKRNSKGLMAILELFGNAERIIEQYEIEYREQQINQMQGCIDEEDQFNSHNQKSIGSIKLSKEEQYTLASLKTTRADPKVLEKLETIKKQSDEKAMQEARKVEQYKEAQQKQKNNLRKQLEKRSVEQGVSIIKDRETNLIFRDGSKNTTSLNKHGLTEYEIWDLQFEEDRERYLVEQLFRRYHKIFKYAFFKYANSGSKVGKPKDFDELKDQSDTINEAEFWAFLKDYELIFNVSKEQVRALLRSIAIQLLKCKNELTNFNYEGFKHIITQYACIIFTKMNKYVQPHFCIELMLQKMQQVTANKGQNTQLYDDPDNMYFAQKEVIKEFNKKLAEDPKYVLPEGYKSQKEEVVKFYHVFEIQDGNTFAYQILDEIVYNVCKCHIIEPLTAKEFQIICKPNLLGYVESKVKQNLEKDHYMEQKNKLLKKSVIGAQSEPVLPLIPKRNLEIEPFRQYSLGIKLELAKIPFNQGKQRSIMEQAADVLEDIIFAVENNQKTITRKWNIVNKVQKDKQDEKKKEELENKKRDEKIQKNHEETKVRLEQMKKDKLEKQKVEEIQNAIKRDLKKIKQEEKQKEQETYLKSQKEKIAQKQKEEEQERLKREVLEKKQRAEEIQKKKEEFKQFNDKKIEQYGEIFKAEQSKLKMAVEERKIQETEYQRMHEAIYKSIEKKGEQIKIKEKATSEFIQKLFRNQIYQNIFTTCNFKLSYLYELLQLEYYKSIEMVDFKEIPLKLWMWFGDRFRMYPDIITQVEFIRVFNAITYRQNDIQASLDYVEFLEALFRISIKGYQFFNKLAQNIKRPKAQKQEDDDVQMLESPPQSVKRTQQTKEFMLNRIKEVQNEQEKRLEVAKKELEEKKKMEKEALILDNYQALNDIIGTDKIIGLNYNEQTLDALITYLALPNDKTGIELRFRYLMEIEAKKKPTKVRKQEASQKLDEDVTQWKEHRVVESSRQPIFTKRTNKYKQNPKPKETQDPILQENNDQEYQYQSDN